MPIQEKTPKTRDAKEKGRICEGESSEDYFGLLKPDSRTKDQSVKRTLDRRFPSPTPWSIEARIGKLPEIFGGLEGQADAPAGRPETTRGTGDKRLTGPLQNKTVGTFQARKEMKRKTLVRRKRGIGIPRKKKKTSARGRRVRLMGRFNKRGQRTR